MNPIKHETLSEQAVLQRTAWRCVAAVICTIVLSVGGCTSYKNKLWYENGYQTKMVKTYSTGLIEVPGKKRY